ncbi:MAG: DegT/DnrJ/EryC1/StrS family aminotransferase [Anaerolineae bacterium]
MKVPFVDLKAQYASIRAEVNEAISQVLDNTDFVLGQSTSLFENEFAHYCEAKAAVGVDSGTSALELALRAYRIGSGDEVITAANTFIATALAISYTGATPVFVDVDPVTYNMDPRQLDRAITDRTKAIIPVHLYGQPADMDPIMEIAHHYELVVIEDACQAHGARYKGKRTGSLGHAAAFSFYPSKNLGAFGDGGMVVTNDEEIAASVKMMRNYGQVEKYRHVLRGYNHRLDTLQAAVLRVKLQHLDDWNAARRRHAAWYRQALEGLSTICPTEADYAEAVYHLYVVRVHDRENLSQNLQQQGIACGVHYPIPIHLQEAYRDLGYEAGSFPVTERYARQILSLPMYPELGEAQLAHVAKAFADAMPETERQAAQGEPAGELVPGIAGVAGGR